MNYAQIKKWNQFSFNLRFLTEHFLGPLLPDQILHGWNSRIQKNILKDVSHTSPETIHEVPAVDTLTPQVFLRDYFNKCHPVVFKGGAKNWMAVKQWDFAFLKENFGSESVILSYHEAFGEAHLSKPPETTNLENIIDHLDSPNLKYARFHPLVDQNPKLLDDFDYSTLGKLMVKNLSPKTNFHPLFIGGKGSKTPIHNAGNENWFVQIQGRKRWFLWDPKAIYIFSPKVNRSPAKYCDFDPRNPDDSRYPCAPYFPAYCVDLEPGDMLYIPSYMWHYVENLTHTIGVATRWLVPSNTIKNCPLLAFLELFNTSPSIFKTMFMEDMDFNKILAKQRKVLPHTLDGITG